MTETAFPIFRGLTVGHGVDLVDIQDFSRLLKDPAIDYLNQYFTENELVAAGDGVTRTQRLAGRFAVKEAVMKALGTGWGNGVMFTDVEVVNLASGQPTVLLHRNLALIMQQREISGWLVSISHTSTLAFASVIAIQDKY
jgi:holo-[acyl-carrier protein] synthase